MNFDQALEITNKVVFAQWGRQLSDVETAILMGAWQSQTYEQTAEAAGYSVSYLTRDVGPKFWKLLSKALGENVSKTNFRAALERQWRESMHESQGQKGKEVQSASISPKPDFLEFPGGPVPLDSLFYIERPPIEELAYAQISKPGSLLRLKAPRQMGKTSLMHRILAHAKQQGFHTVLLSLQRADSSIFTSLDKFLRWLCANVSRQLNLEPRLDDYWDEDIGSKVSCSIYFQEFLLAEIDSPMVLALDEVNRIFEYPEISSDFLPLLRSWYEDASELEIWKKLRLVVVHATEAYIPLDINQSPFNVGLPIKLPEFSLEQAQELAVRHRLDWSKSEEGVKNLALLLTMVGGHPYLIRIALYHLARQEVSLNQLLQTAPTVSGVYSDRLRHHLANLQEHPELATAFKRVVTSNEPVQLEAIAAYKLESMGLVKLEGNLATPSCELYRLYFREQLG
ncbi:AAA-like domain-containing protein [Chroococcidiopsis sp.]|uniref:AAA-like domain-containing protein n=1 Tax=Chroococcidiopsis sp. TaxID=3088168 RepID=UPI003F3085CF